MSSLRPLRLCGEILNDSYCFSKLGALYAFAARPVEYSRGRGVSVAVEY